MNSALKDLFYSLMPRWALMRSGGPGRIYLTFDDGPCPGKTERILETLRQNEVQATFFMVGDQVIRYPELARRVRSEGHAIASHSFDHRKFAHWDFSGVWGDLAKMRRIFLQDCAITTKGYRPPYGRLTLPLVLYALIGKAQILLWTKDSLDGFSKNAQEIVERCRDAKGGDVILFHDDNDLTPEALPEIIREAKSRSLQFGTFSGSEA